MIEQQNDYKKIILPNLDLELDSRDESFFTTRFATSALSLRS